MKIYVYGYLELMEPANGKAIKRLGIGKEKEEDDDIMVVGGFFSEIGEKKISIPANCRILLLIRRKHLKLYFFTVFFSLDIFIEFTGFSRLMF